MLKKNYPEYCLKAIIQDPRRSVPPREFTEDVARRAHNFHQQLPAYSPTRLVALKALAKAWDVGNIYVKDESTRFGLKAFKVLGGSYAVARLICKKLGLSLEETTYQYLLTGEARSRIGGMTFVAATDGNHGRGIAWTAQQFGQQAVIYMPRGTAQARAENIRGHGAEVTVTDLNYDDTVRLARRAAEENGWHMVQDTAWDGYEEIPLWVMQGYMTMPKEAVEQMAEANTAPTHVFVQAGVGAMSGAVIGYLANTCAGRPPKFIIMEPNNAACIFASAAAGDGRPHAVRGDLDTIMAGLACGEPNPIAWSILRDFPSGYISIDDYVAANGTCILANPLASDSAVEAGESGSVGIGLLDLLTNKPAFEEIKNALAIGPDSKLLFFNTEGATDPVTYRKILRHGKYPAPMLSG